MAYGGNCPKCARKDNLIVPLHWYKDTNTCLRCGYQREYIEGAGWRTISTGKVK